MNKAELRQLIAGGRIEAAIEALLAAAAETEPGLHQDTLLLSARYQEYKRAQRNNLESPGELERRLNQITFALLEIVKGLPDGFAMPPLSGDIGDIPPSAGKGTVGAGTGTGTGGPIFTGTGDGSPILTGTGDGRLPSKAPFWFSVSAFAVLLAISLFMPGWSQQNNTLFKTLLALAAAGVAATLPGFLNFELGNMVKAGGALAAFTLVFLVNPVSEAPLTLTVFLQGKNGQSLKSLHQHGYVLLDVNGERKKELIDDKGQAHFKNLYAGDKVRNVDIEFSEPLQPVRPDSVYTIDAQGQIYLEVAMKHLGHIYGTVLAGDGALEGVIVTVDNLRDTTDLTGSYSIDIPETMQRTDPEVKFHKTGYKLLIKKAYPQTNQPLNVVMEKNKF